MVDNYDQNGPHERFQVQDIVRATMGATNHGRGRIVSITRRQHPMDDLYTVYLDLPLDTGDHIMAFYCDELTLVTPSITTHAIWSRA